MNYVKSSKIPFKSHSELNEKWLQKQIEEDPSILGLGENVEWIQSERRQSSGGRLDLLLKDSGLDKRFTVELQLGECDPDHIIRTIEYWDLERKKYPQFKHCAVIIAEKITSRFWNVINLFNGSVPLIAIQLDVREVEDKFTLNFIKVLDEREHGMEEEEGSEPTDRAYWENTKSTPEMLFIVDDLKNTLNKFFPNVELNYTKYYIGLKKNYNISNNFVLFRPTKSFVDIEIRKNTITEKTVNDLENAGLRFDRKESDTYPYKVRVHNKKYLEQNMPHIENLFQKIKEPEEPVKNVA